MIKNFLSLLQKYRERLEKLKSKTAENSYNKKVDLEHLLSIVAKNGKIYQRKTIFQFQNCFMRWVY